MKISARNTLRGKIVEVKKGTTTSHVRIDIGGQIVTAAITNESADDRTVAENSHGASRASGHGLRPRTRPAFRVGRVFQPFQGEPAS